MSEDQVWGASGVLLVGRLLQNNRNYVGMDGISSVGV